MSQLPTNQQSGQPARITSPALSPELRRLLDFEPSADKAVAEIASSGPLWHEAQKALPALRSFAIQRAGEEGVRNVLGRRFALYPQPDRSDSEWAAWWADYYDALADCSLAGLEAAMAAYVKDPASEFMPKPGKLLELAKNVENPAAGAYARARRAVEGAERQEAERVRPPPTPEQAAAVRKMLADYQSKVSAPDKVKAHPDMPATHGKTDERGVTPELRALIARQQEQQR